jgi:hypothetical protein
VKDRESKGGQKERERERKREKERERERKREKERERKRKRGNKDREREREREIEKGTQTEKYKIVTFINLELLTALISIIYSMLKTKYQIETNFSKVCYFLSL